MLKPGAKVRVAKGDRVFFVEVEGIGIELEIAENGRDIVCTAVGAPGFPDEVYLFENLAHVVEEVGGDIDDCLAHGNWVENFGDLGVPDEWLGIRDSFHPLRRFSERRFSDRRKPTHRGIPRAEKYTRKQFRRINIRSKDLYDRAVDFMAGDKVSAYANAAEILGFSAAVGAALYHLIQRVRGHHIEQVKRAPDDFADITVGEETTTVPIDALRLWIKLSEEHEADSTPRAIMDMLESENGADDLSKSVDEE